MAVRYLVEKEGCDKCERCEVDDALDKSVVRH